ASGSGKSESQIIPAIFDLASQKNPPCLVITDPKGALYKATSGYLAQQDFRVKVIAPANLAISNRFNPLHGLSTIAEFKQLSDALLLAAEFDGHNESIWSKAGKDHVTMIVTLVKSLPNKDDHGLHNVLKFVRLSSSGELDRLFAAYGDDELLTKYKSFLMKNEEYQAGLIANAEQMLERFEDPDLAALMAHDDLDLDSFRTGKPTAIFMIFPAEKAKYYGFLASLLYQRVFDLCSSRLDPRDRDVFCFLEEFTNCPKIPNFINYLTYIRQFRVSVNIYTQAVSQIQKVYGSDDCKTILDGACASRLYLGQGIGATDAKELSFRLGQVTKKEKESTLTNALMKPEELEQLDMKKCVLLQRGLPPALLRKRHYKSYRFTYKKWAAIEPYQPEKSCYPPLSFVDLQALNIVEPSESEENVVEAELEPSEDSEVKAEQELSIEGEVESKQEPLGNDNGEKHE
ncbi:MAG: type IV secretory system conjugative DNA transfer family protein, partial [SAR324 cluster bacterium]|nr:type IV secretory system conjugative DNA transfer family protein [SAR324 cluster bacterium]